MTDVPSPRSSHPVITEARLKITGKRSPVWDLFAGEVLVGWTSAKPLPAPTSEGYSPPFTPSCWQYGTGQHVVVAYASTLTVS